jgi:phage regulator Rha-like protein
MSQSLPSPGASPVLWRARIVRVIRASCYWQHVELLGADGVPTERILYSSLFGRFLAGEELEFEFPPGTKPPDGIYTDVRIAPPSPSTSSEIEMNLPAIAQSQAIRMTSEEIATVVNQRHDNVKRTIETLAKKGVIAFPQIEEKPATGGRPGTVYVFDEAHKLDSITVVAQLSPQFTAALVKRWDQLEKQTAAPALPDFTNPALAARAWADEVEQKLALAHQVETLAPKVATLERIEASDAHLTFTQAAKILQVKRAALTDALHAAGWIYRQNKSWMPTQAAIAAGRLVARFAHYTNEITGQEDERGYCHLTRKGLTQIADRMGLPLPMDEEAFALSA